MSMVARARAPADILCPCPACVSSLQLSIQNKKIRVPPSVPEQNHSMVLLKALALVAAWSALASARQTFVFNAWKCNTNFDLDQSACTSTRAARAGRCRAR